MIKSSAESIGFTLMEVLVALVILSIAFAAVFQSMSVNAKTLFYLQNKTAANWVAMNIIAEAQLKLINATDLGTHIAHQEIMLDKIWYWNIAIQTTSNPDILQMDVSVKQTEPAASIIHVVGFLRNNS